jgi:hypothetical protein
MSTTTQIQILIFNGAKRAHETRDEARTLARFARGWSTSDKVEYVLDHAADPCAAFDALGLSARDLEREEVTSSARRALLSDLMEAADLVFVGDEIQDRDDCEWLTEEDCWALRDDCVEVHIGRRRTVWRHHEADSFFYCNWVGLYYDNDAYQAVTVNGETVCYEANESDIFYWESDGEYHSDPEPEEDGNDLGLSAYHGGRRGPVKAGEAVSIELEVAVKDPSPDFGDEVRAVADAAEHDGSLPDNGAEIIFGSVTMAEVTNKVHTVLAVLRRFDCAGHLGSNAGFGMHINVSRHGWGISNATLARILLLVGQGQTFWEVIAQRSETNWAHYRGKTAADAVSRVKGYGQKYEAVAIRGDDRLEFRLFRSSCRPERVLKNVEAVAAIIRFCKGLENHRDATLENFRAFLRGHAPVYPNLCQFITDKGL